MTAHPTRVGADPHLAIIRPVPGPVRRACAECVKLGTPWVHLRQCLTCGQVGCCDSSVGRHAERHFKNSRHPVIRSFEPDESWRWCYLDERLG